MNRGFWRAGLLFESEGCLGAVFQKHKCPALRTVAWAAFPADEMFGDSMHQQMCSRSSDAWESCHLVLTASWLISTFQMADRKKRSPSRSASGSFHWKCVHIKCCSGSKPHDQRGHEEAHSPGCCLSLGNGQLSSKARWQGRCTTTRGRR